MLLTTVKSILNTKLKNDIRLLDDNALANNVYEALFYVAQNSEPSVLVEPDDSDHNMLRKLPDGGFIRIPQFPNFSSSDSLDIDEVLSFAVIYKALSFISHDASQVAEYEMRAKQLIGFYNTSSNDDIPNAVILHEAFVSMASLRDSLDDISDIASNLNELLAIDMSIINSVFTDIGNWRTLNVSTGAEGSSVTYNASTNTLTIPRGNTGAQGVQGIQGIQGEKGDTGDALTVTSIINNPDYTLTLNFSDGTIHTTGVLRGLQGEQGIQGIQGEQGIQGLKGDKGDSVTNVTSSKTGKTTTVTVEVENNPPFTFDVEDGLDGESSGDMLMDTYDTNGDGKVDAADNADKLGGYSVAGENTGNTIPLRNSLGDVAFRLIQSDYPNHPSIPDTAGICFRNNSTGDTFLRVATPDAFKQYLEGIGTFNNIQTQLDDKASSSHNHDSDYLGITAKAADSDKLDGLDSDAFALVEHTHDSMAISRPTKVSQTSILVDGVTLAIPSPVAGTDYYFSKTAITTTWQADTIGGFHYSLVGHMETPTGNKTEADMVLLRGINAHSIWTKWFRPTCDPRGMFFAGGKWYDIYLMDEDYALRGYSKPNVYIAGGATDYGRKIPKIPEAYGGDGTVTYGKFTWFQAAEVGKAVGKQLIPYDEFVGVAYGVVEGTDSSTVGEGTVGLIEHYGALASIYGMEQATGTQWIWGQTIGQSTSGSWASITDGRGQVYSNAYAVLLGGRSTSGVVAGSRASRWFYSVSNSYWSFGARFACDHLMLA